VEAVSQVDGDSRKPMPNEDVATSGRTPEAVLPSEASERKAIPIVSGVLDYFPSALIEVARVSKAGNDQHNPGQPLHWSRGKSADHADTIVRHLTDRGTFDTDGIRHSAKVAWRALALLQEELEAAGDPPGRGSWFDDEPRKKYDSWSDYDVYVSTPDLIQAMEDMMTRNKSVFAEMGLLKEDGPYGYTKSVYERERDEASKVPHQDGGSTPIKIEPGKEVKAFKVFDEDPDTLPEPPDYPSSYWEIFPMSPRQWLRRRRG
jgi:hypothetical protein